MQSPGHVSFLPLDRRRLDALLDPELRARLGPLSPFFASAPARLRAAFDANGLRAPERTVLLAIVDGAETLVEIYAPNPLLGASALRVDVVFLGDAAEATPGRRRAALEGARAHVFSTTTAMRLDVLVPAHDASLRHTCTRAGFRFEGILRAAAVRHGGPVDLALFGTTRPPRLMPVTGRASTPASIRRIAMLTGGGDAPGLNAVIRAVVKSAAVGHGWSVLGVEDGFEGLLGTPRVVELAPNDVRGLLPRGGTILGTTNRGSFGRGRATQRTADYSESIDDAIANLGALGVDALVTIGGNGTQTIAADFASRGVRVIGIPKTIDNDLAGTDTTFGFDTAVAAATDACDRLHTTAESHDRVMVLEVMGRTTGWIALSAGIAGGADCILVPELPFDIRRVVDAIALRDRAGHRFSIVVVAEGAAPAGGASVYVEPAAAGRAPRLGGIAADVAAEIASRTDKDVRVVVLGHLQRGGSPTSHDRLLATTLGTEAVNALAAGQSGRMLAVAGTSVVAIRFDEVAGRVKTVPPDSPLLETARALGIELGADCGLAD